MGKCNTFWGSHGCDLEDGHNSPCECIHDADGQGAGDTSKLVKIETSSLAAYHVPNNDGKFGVVFYDGFNTGHLVNWFQT